MCQSLHIRRAKPQLSISYPYDLGAADASWNGLGATLLLGNARVSANPASASVQAQHRVPGSGYVLSWSKKACPADVPGELAKKPQLVVISQEKDRLTYKWRDIRGWTYGAVVRVVAEGKEYCCRADDLHEEWVGLNVEACLSLKKR